MRRAPQEARHIGASDWSALAGRSRRPARRSGAWGCAARLLRRPAPSGDWLRVLPLSLASGTRGSSKNGEGRGGGGHAAACGALRGPAAGWRPPAASQTGQQRAEAVPAAGAGRGAMLPPPGSPGGRRRCWRLSTVRTLAGAAWSGAAAAAEPHAGPGGGPCRLSACPRAAAGMGGRLGAHRGPRHTPSRQPGGSDGPPPPPPGREAACLQARWPAHLEPAAPHCCCRASTSSPLAATSGCTAPLPRARTPMSSCW